MTEEEIKAMKDENAKMKADIEALTKSKTELESAKADIDSKYLELQKEHEQLIRGGKPLPEGKTGAELFAELFK